MPPLIVFRLPSSGGNYLAMYIEKLMKLVLRYSSIYVYIAVTRNIMNNICVNCCGVFVYLYSVNIYITIRTKFFYNLGAEIEGSKINNRKKQLKR